MGTIEACRTLPALSDALWVQRHLLEQLLYRLVSAELVLAAGAHRFVARALDEVEHTADQLHDAEGPQHAALAATTDDLGVIRDGSTLAVIAARSPEPWASILGEHREAFRCLLEQVEDTAARNHRLASGALGRVRAALRDHTPSSPTLGSDGLSVALQSLRRVPSVASAGSSRGAASDGGASTLMELQMQEVAYRCALAALDRLVPTSLVRLLA